jgi:hypothetical protein
LDQFIIFLLGAFSVTLCVIFAMETRSRKISLLAGFGTLTAVVGAAATIYYTAVQLDRWGAEDQPKIEVRFKGSAGGLQAVSSTSSKYTFALLNTGKGEATDVKIKVWAIDHHELLVSEGCPRLKSEDPARWVTTTVANDDHHLAFCNRLQVSKSAQSSGDIFLYISLLHEREDEQQRVVT